MSHLFIPEASVAALIVRAAVVYGFLLVALRVAGRRELAQMTSSDLILLLVISNAVQNSMNAGDNSLAGGLVSATTLIGVNYLVGVVTFRSKRLEAILEGRPQVVIHDGKVFEDVMARAQLTHHELQAALRQAGCATSDDVRAAILENNGTISVIPRSRNGAKP